jgi:hypothetical protein
LRCREVAEGHSNFVAGTAAGAALAVFLYLVAEEVPLGGMEVEVFKERREPSKKADTFDAAGFGSMEDCLDKEAAGSVSFDIGTNHDGAHLGKVRAINVESRATQERVIVGFDDCERTNVHADLDVGASQERSVMGETFDELMDGVGVTQLCLARSHRACF